MVDVDVSEYEWGIGDMYRKLMQVVNATASASASGSGSASASASEECVST